MLFIDRPITKCEKPWFSWIFNKFGLFGLLALFMLTSSWCRFCHVAGTDGDVGTDVGSDMAGWLGRYIGQNSDKGLTQVPTWRMMWAGGTESGKWFYWTAFGTGVVFIRAGPMKSDEDTHLFYDGKITMLSDANSHMLGSLQNRRGPSDLGGRIGGLIECKATSTLRREEPPKY